ncbi:MAG: FCD domain-containing protein, partial [Myxococcota bacterium]
KKAVKLWGLFLSDVLGMRLTLMGFAIRRLIDRLTPDDISRLRHKVSTFIDAVSSGVKPPELADLENQIIAEVLASTHSTVIQLSLNPLSRSYMGIRKFQDVIYRDPQQNALGYTLFLRWLDQPDPNLVATILEILEKRDEVTIDLVVEHVRATNRESD